MAAVVTLKDEVNRLVEAGAFDEALRALDVAGASSGYLRFKRAVCCARLGKWGDALADARAAARDDATLSEECAWLAAEALRRLARPAEAEAAYLGLAAEGATPERRRSAKALAALAREERDDWTGASTLYRELLAADPADEEASFRLAFCLERGGLVAEAAEAWAAFLRDHGEGAEGTKASFRLGMVLYRQGRYPAAVEAFERAAAGAGETFLGTMARQMVERAGAKRTAMEKGVKAYDPRS